MTFRRVLAAWSTHLPRWQVRAALALFLSGSNAVGIAVVMALLLIVLPMPPTDRRHVLDDQTVLLYAAYIVVAGGLGVTHAFRTLHPVVDLLRPGAKPTSATEKRSVLAAPRRIFFFQASLWAACALLFFLFMTRFSVALGTTVSLVIGLAGWATSCLTYLLAERALRPVARKVLESGIPDRRYVRTVAGRSMFAWALGTGVAVLGIVIVGVTALTRSEQTSTRQLAITVVVLGAITLAVGSLSSYVAAQASSEPIRNLREALHEVESGRLDTHVGVYDGTEIGVLQAGFNQMVDGLREREQLRDLFGRHVGADVAKAALQKGVRLGGEARDVAVLFVDIIGSTALAEDRPPEEVVALLNRFFEVVIEVVHDYDGWINKFEGDAALAIWGAPMQLEGMHACALAAARVLGERLEAEVPEIKAGIGVSCGTAVAGNVGTAERYEYTVIGDPVNEAARLTGLAKKVPHRVVANYGLVAAAGAEEAALWEELEPVTVRGRTAPTRIATPRARRPEAVVQPARKLADVTATAPL